MRILILSCNTGEGHNSCAKALQETFCREKEACEIKDALAFVSKSASKVISKGHITIYRHFSGLNRWGYRYTEEHSGLYGKTSFTYKYLCSGKKRLSAYIDRSNFDAVICTHPFAAIMLTEARKLCNKEIYTAFVGTDYTCSPTTEASMIDTYFIPDESLKKEFTKCGLPEEKLVASGIPVREMFYRSERKETAKEAQGISAEHMHLLVMCGSMGCGHMEKLVSHIANILHDKEEMTVVCGTNRQSKRKLMKRYKNISNIHIKGYVDDISFLMDSADLYLTKPGGISVTEAKIKNLPMVYVNVVAGCEEYNRRFFVNAGGAVSGKDGKEIAEQCKVLMRNQTKREEMERNLSDLEHPHSAQFIYEYLKNKISEKNVDCL